MVRLFIYFLLQIHIISHNIIIITAKFNCTVPGTLSDFSDECNITMTATTGPTSSTMIANSVVSTEITNMVNEFDNIANPGILSIVLVGCIVIFTLCVTILCGVFMFQRIKQKRQTQTFSEGQAVMQGNLITNALHHSQEEQQQNHYGI